MHLDFLSPVLFLLAVGFPSPGLAANSKKILLSEVSALRPLAFPLIRPPLLTETRSNP